MRKLLVMGLAVLLVSCVSVPASKDQSLFELIERRDISAIKERLSTETVNVHDDDGESLLHKAVVLDDADVIRLLLSLGAERESADPHGNTPLMKAVVNDYAVSAKTLAEHDASVFAQNDALQSPVDRALEKGTLLDIATAKTIMQRNSAGKTMLDLAIERGDKPLTDALLTIVKTSLLPHERQQVLKNTVSLSYHQPHTQMSAAIAQALLYAQAEPAGGALSTFEIATIKRNYAMRFDNGNTALHEMAWHGYPIFTQFLLDQSVNPNTKNNAGSTALHLAVAQGHVETVRLLLKRGANPNAQDAFGNTPLLIAIPQQNQIPIITALLDAGAVATAKDSYGESALHIAARIGIAREGIILLLQHGALVNERNKKGETALSLAIERANQAAIRVFIDAGADINAEDITGKTALTKALETDVKTLSLLISEKTIAERDSLGRTPLHLAVIKNASEEIISFLLQSHAPINVRDKMGNTPLHYAVAQNQERTGKLLLRSQADIFSSNISGDSALTLALKSKGNQKEWFLNAHTISLKDARGNTPLHIAAELDLPSAILFILQKGADINVQNNNAESPLFNAIKTHSLSALKTLLHPKGLAQANLALRDFLGNSVLHTAVHWSAFEALQLLLKEPVIVAQKLHNSQNLAGKTPLHIAAKEGKVRVIDALLAAKVAIDAQDEIGRTPLFEAVAHEQVEATTTLLRAKASPSLRDMYGRLPLYEAVIKKHQTLVRLLNQAGADPLAQDLYGVSAFSKALDLNTSLLDTVIDGHITASDTNGNTPLHLALLNRADPSVFLHILKKGSPIDKRNKHGDSVLFLAVQQNNRLACTALLQAGADPFSINVDGKSPLYEVIVHQPQLLQLFIEEAGFATDATRNGIAHYLAQYASEELLTKVLSDTRLNWTQENLQNERPKDVALRWKRPNIAKHLP